MLSRRRCTGLRERGVFSPVLLVMAPQGLLAASAGRNASVVAAGLAGDRLQVSGSGSGSGEMEAPHLCGDLNGDLAADYAAADAADAATQYRPPRTLLFI